MIANFILMFVEISVRNKCNKLAFVYVLIHNNVALKYWIITADYFSLDDRSKLFKRLFAQFLCGIYRCNKIMMLMLNFFKLEFDFNVLLNVDAKLNLTNSYMTV